MKNADYYAENSGEFEDLTDAQQQTIFEGGEVVETSDTEELRETNDIEEVATSEKSIEESKTEEVSGDANTESEEDKDPELMAKDGKNTIPYSQLSEARERGDQLEQIAEQQKILIDQLQADQKKDELEGTTEAQDALIEEYEGDYPEIAEEMKPLFEKMLNEGISKAIEGIESKLDDKVAPLHQARIEDANKVRNDAILAEHPDGVELYGDPKLKEWIDSHSPAIKNAYDSIMEASTAEDMIGLFSAYKDANGLNKSDESKSLTEKAKDIIAKTKGKTPVSMTEIPSTVPVDNNEVEVAQNMSQSQIAQHLEGKTPEQISSWMNKVM